MERRRERGEAAKKPQLHPPSPFIMKIDVYILPSHSNPSLTIVLLTNNLAVYLFSRPFFYLFYLLEWLTALLHLSLHLHRRSRGVRSVNRYPVANVFQSGYD